MNRTRDAGNTGYFAPVDLSEYRARRREAMSSAFLHSPIGDYKPAPTDTRVRLIDVLDLLVGFFFGISPWLAVAAVVASYFFFRG